jgi:hypothetical protein
MPAILGNRRTSFAGMARSYRGLLQHARLNNEILNLP